MVGKFKNVFFAYPAEPAELTGPIQSAAKTVSIPENKLEVKVWPQLSTFGAYIPDEIRTAIHAADIFACDITRANLNVYYEIGFAIGIGKPVAPVINNSFAGVIEDVQRDGFFDNIGYVQYENSAELASNLLNLPTTPLVELYSKPINFQQPLFLLDTFRKTDFRNAIVSSIKLSKVFYRSFDPVEVARFSTVSIIADATASAGIIIPVLAGNIDDAPRHNLRAAFLAGLGHGLERQTLLLQLRGTSGPADFRDEILPVKDEKEVMDNITKFAATSILSAQSISQPPGRRAKSALQRLTLGASAAENEFRTLADYFVETAEFVRTRRGEVSIVTGRKGSGKTAIFFQVRDSFRREKTLVTDLKPESHQLSLFREELLKVVGAGAFDHTLAAFWYFVVLSELLLSLKGDLEYRSRSDPKSLEQYRDVEDQMDKLSINDSGDFTSRINRLGSEILQELQRLQKKGEMLTPERLTNIVFASGIAKIKGLLLKHADANRPFVLLFDNIDKGWPANGVHQFDVRLVRLLIEALDKIRRDFAVQHHDFKSVVFLRNDIYELLVEGTPDRGKAGEARIDWTDRAKLRQVIFKRLQSSTQQLGKSFVELWRQYFVAEVHSKDSFDYLVDHCLMRPRFLINLVENAISNAINRGHTIVAAEDCIDAVRQHSLYLVDDFGYEIRDVSGFSADLLYSLIGVTKLITRSEALERFKDAGISDSEAERAFYLLLWYGVLGVAEKDGSEKYIYDYEYNMKRLEAEVRHNGEDALFVTNPAIHEALRA